MRKNLVTLKKMQCNYNVETGKRMGQDEAGGVMGLMRVLYIRLRNLDTKYVY